MKSYLKNFSLILFVLVVIGTLAMRPVTKKSNTKIRSCPIFIYVPGSFPNPHDPGKYVAAPPGYNPDEDCDKQPPIVCALEVCEIYPPNHPTNPGKPKVDGDNGNPDVTIDDWIDAVLANPSLQGIANANGGKVWLRSIQ